MKGREGEGYSIKLQNGSAYYYHLCISNTKKISDKKNLGNM